MKKKLVAFFVFLLMSQILFGQKEGYNWTFGHQCGYDFNVLSGSYNQPQIINNIVISQVEGMASLSDQWGNLLLYSDGITVWDYRNNNAVVLTNLGGDISSTQSALILQKPKNPADPGDTNTFYIFTVFIGDNPFLVGDPSKGLRYSKIEWDPLTSSYHVLINNKRLLWDAAEKLTAIKHADDASYWIATHTQSYVDRHRQGISDSLFFFKLDYNGVSQTPNISKTGHEIGAPNGYIKFSPDGTKLACNYFDRDTVRVYEFDKSNGELVVGASQYFAPTPFTRVYGLEFSPDGSKLFVSSYDGQGIPNVMQIDLTGTISAQNEYQDTRMLGITYGGAIQMAPNGYLYMMGNGGGSYSTNTPILIDNPNSYSAALDHLNATGFSGGSYLIKGLPNFRGDIFYTRDITVLHRCLNDVTQFRLGDDAGVTSVTWEVYDHLNNLVASSNDIYFDYTFQNPGQYHVVCTINNFTPPVSYTKSFEIYANPTVELDNDLCLDPNDLPLSVDAGIFNSYSWNDGTDGRFLEVYSVGLYSVTVTNENGCSASDDIFIKPCSCQYEFFQTAISHDMVNFEEGRSIKYTYDCGFIGAVNSVNSSSGLEQMELLKLQGDGNVLWNKSYVPDEDFTGNLLNVEQTTDGGYVSCGWISNGSDADNPDKDYYILKTDIHGVPEWSMYSNQPQDEELHDIEQTSDGGYVSVGYTNTLYTLSPVVVKLDANGDVEWSMTYLEAGYYYGGYGRSIELIDDNGDGVEDGYLVTGYVDSRNQNNLKDVMMMRINSDGSVNWVKVLPMEGDQEGRGIIQVSPGNYAVTGYTRYTDPMGSLETDLFLLEYDINDPNGRIYFNRIGSSGLDEGYAIEVMIDGTYVIAGEITDQSYAKTDALLLNVAPGGGIIWSHVYGGNSPSHVEWARSVEISPKNYHIAFIGTTDRYITPDGDHDYYVVNTNSQGLVYCRDQSKTLNSMRIIFHELSILPYGYLEVNMEPIETIDTELAYTQEFCDEMIIRKSDDKQDNFESSFDGNLQVYPVPVDETKQLNFDYQTTRDEVIKVSVVDLLGNVLIETTFVANKEMVNSYQLDLSKQTAGTYILKVQGDQKEYTSKIMIVE